MTVLHHDTSKEEGATFGEHVGVLSGKGQVTLPAAIRSFLRLKVRDHVAFAIQGDKVIVKRPSRLQLEDTFGAVQPLTQPENFKTLRQKAIEDHIDRNANK